ncbi:hypothetical protein [Microbacterium maritypicum]
MASTTRSRNGSFDSEGQPVGAQPFAAQVRMTDSSTVVAIMRQMMGSPWRAGITVSSPSTPMFSARAAAAGSTASNPVTVRNGGSRAGSGEAASASSMSAIIRLVSSRASSTNGERPRVRNASPATSRSWRAFVSTLSRCESGSTSRRQPSPSGGCPCTAPSAM